MVDILLGLAKKKVRKEGKKKRTEDRRASLRGTPCGGGPDIVKRSVYKDTEI